ncbi:MAG: hypothetical protein ACXVNN_02505, partial [Bacteroidia bacterium]
MKSKIHPIGTPGRFSILIIVILLFTCCLSSFSQAPAPVFSVKLKFSVQQGGLENSLITITKNGSPYRVIDPS